MPGGRFVVELGFQRSCPSLPIICLYSSLNLSREFGPASAELLILVGVGVSDPQPDPSRSEAATPTAAFVNRFTLPSLDETGRRALAPGRSGDSSAPPRPDHFLRRGAGIAIQ